ncbi:hypothetical protein KL953_34945 [Mycolicibacterium goodii]|uniref:hypothetical protein n=1 Tax=Mycolicibacterium goodii TaxID=134601 RepID=UPI001BDBF1D1|nr:hypothetical protein [Mycolicibacterium goodii]MBU8814061.1 hypothetical protein [Mycolicibacterium goodii]
MIWSLPGVLSGPALQMGAELFADVYKTFHQLFGEETPPARPDPPVPPNVQPGTTNPAEDQAQKDTKEGEQKNGESAQQGKEHADQTAKGAEDDKKKLEELWKEHQENAKRTANGGTGDTDNATTQTLRDGVSALRNAVSGAADNSALRAGGLPMPNLGGLNPLGMGGGGMNPMGMFPGGGGMPMPGGGGAGLPFGFGGDAGNPHDQHVPNPLDTAQSAPNTPGPLSGDHTPEQPAPATHEGPGDNTPQTPPAGDGHGHAIVADPAAANSREVVAADGEKTTAPDDVAAAVLKHAVANPNSPNMVDAAYAAANITLPGNGADPGKVVGIGEVEPADIVRLADHDAFVWGNGKVLNPDGTTQPIDEAINASTLKGIFRPIRNLAAASNQSATPVSNNENSASSGTPASTNDAETEAD